MPESAWYPMQAFVWFLLVSAHSGDLDHEGRLSVSGRQGWGRRKESVYNDHLGQWMSETVSKMDIVRLENDTCKNCF